MLLLPADIVGGLAASAAPVLAPRVASGASAPGRSHPSARATDGQFCTAGRWSGKPAPVPTVPSCAQPCRVVGPGSESDSSGLLVATFAPTGPLVVGIDETIERRRGPKIAAAGIYRDPVRSSHSHLVKVNGLRWICLHLLVPVPWAGTTWALPFLTALAPSERYAQRRHRRFKPLTLWARQLIRLVHR